jgi:hypothetical protein
MTCLPPVAISIMWYIFLQCLIPPVSLPPLSLHAMTLSWFPTVPLSVVSLFPVVSLAQLSLSGLPYIIATIALPFKPTFYQMDLKKNFLMKPLSVSSWPVSYLSPRVSPLDNGSTQLVCVCGGGGIWSWHPPPTPTSPPQPSSHPPPPPPTMWLCVGVQWFSQSNGTHHQRIGPTFIVKLPHLSLHKLQTSAVS